MTMLIVGMTRSGLTMLMAMAAFCLPLSVLKAEKYYKLTEPMAESADGSKPKPPEPSKPVDPHQFKRFIVVDVSAQRVDLYEDGEVVFSTPASTGKEDKSTKEGLYHVTDKHEMWISTIYDVPMPHFLRLNSGDVGLHAGYLPGYPASHGCIRLPEAAAAHLYEIIPVGTPVIIQGKAPDKEWIKAQYKVKRSPSSVAYSRSKGGASGEVWQPPYPIVGTSWNKPSEPTPEEVKAEKAKADQARAIQAAKVKADKAKAKADQVRAEQLKADMLKADKAKAEQVKADQAKAEQAKVDKVKAEQAKADKAKADKAKANKAKADQAKAEQKKKAQSS